VEDDGEERQSPEPHELVSLPPVIEIVDGAVKLIEPPDRPEDETGVREPRTPRPQAPSASALPSTE
jgi:hypothetical protein